MAFSPLSFSPWAAEAHRRRTQSRPELCQPIFGDLDNDGIPDAAELHSPDDKLKQMMDAGKGEDGRPIDTETRAYVIYALNLSGTGDAAYLNELFNKCGELQPYGRALLALTLKASGDASRAQEVAAEIERSARSTSSQPTGNRAGVRCWTSPRRTIPKPQRSH